MVAVPIQTKHNVTYATCRETEPGLFLARSTSDVRVQAYGRTEDEAMRKLRHRIEAAEDCAA